MKFSIITLGCKVNEYESQSMITQLESAGHIVIEGLEVADYYIRNLGVVRNGGFFEYKPMFVEQIPVPLPLDEIVDSIEDVFNSDAPEDMKNKQLDDIIESMFDFTEPEIAYLRNL